MDPNNEAETEAAEAVQDPSQEHPAHEAHGGSMAPELVDETGHPRPEDEEK